MEEHFTPPEIPKSDGTTAGIDGARKRIDFLRRCYRLINTLWQYVKDGKDDDALQILEQIKRLITQDT